MPLLLDLDQKYAQMLRCSVGSPHLRVGVKLERRGDVVMKDDHHQEVREMSDKHYKETRKKPQDYYYREIKSTDLAIKYLSLKPRSPHCVFPTRAHEGDAGRDLTCTETVILWPFCSRDLDTGFDIKVPEGTWGSIKARSSTFKRRGILVHEGVIDAGYTGKLSILAFNPFPWPKIVRRGDSLAQLVIVPLVHTITKHVSEMPKTERGNKGWGSTGPSANRTPVKDGSSQMRPAVTCRTTQGGTR
jgi:dUTP pyrophosphatase